MAQDNAVVPNVLPSGTTWPQFKQGGLAVILANLAAANPPKANPGTAAVVNPTGGGASGGSLPAGTYYLCYVWVDPYGETLAGGESAAFTVAAGNIPQVTIPALPAGVSFANLFLSPPGGAAGSEILYASGVTTTTFNLSFAPAPVQPTESLPAANSTGLTGHALARVNTLLSGAFTELVHYDLSSRISQRLSGLPIQRRQWVVGLHTHHGTVATWRQVLAEACALFAANMPTGVSAVTDPRGLVQYGWNLP
jgi:hypothetical protein